MSYFKVLGLEREPFSTSPDPAFFYDSQEHHCALMRLMIEVRLKRGLSIVLGDVGTGKTTLSRKLFHMLKEREDILFNMILDPTYETEELFLDALARIFKIDLIPQSSNILDYKEAIKNFLFKKCVEEGKTVVLLIDEAQKLNSVSLEALRVLLNYETNEFKLLQLILLSQLELLPKINCINNFWDRISMKYMLNPLSEQETKRMISFRLTQAGSKCGPGFFTDEAVAEIYRFTKGYPRRISMICHEALKSLVMGLKPVVDADLVRSLIGREANIKNALING
ncbi:MAG: AAA family ATPase [Candidatus Gastranaerophilales bacterium]|jgi:general secretion pathway protein A|nr:AAA family ATPase [Candidatus Gastranaerophilales bacterium]